MNEEVHKIASFLSVFEMSQQTGHFGEESFPVRVLNEENKVIGIINFVKLSRARLLS